MTRFSRLMHSTIAALVAVPTIAAAALPPCAEDFWIRKATDVVQIEVSKVEIPPGTGASGTGICPVTGSVVRVFKGSMKPGEQITVGVICHSDAVGGMIVTRPETLTAARVLELHMLDGNPIHNGPSVLTLDRPTDEMHWQPNCPD